METSAKQRWQEAEGTRKMFKKKTAEERLKEAEKDLAKEAKKAADKEAKEAKAALPDFEDAKSEVAETPVEDAEVPKPPKDEAKPEPELTQEEKEQLAEIKAYQKEYGDYYAPNDIANIPATVLTAEQMNLSFATVMELRKLRKAIERME